MYSNAWNNMFPRSFNHASKMGEKVLSIISRVGPKTPYDVNPIPLQ